jgi:hypothetical protein
MRLILPLALGGFFISAPAWVLWTLWREWPQRRFTMYGQIVSRERYPLTYWVGLAFGSLFAVPVALKGTEIIVFALTH